MISVDIVFGYCEKKTMLINKKKQQVASRKSNPTNMALTIIGVVLL
jgi:hypothetical protein